MPISPEPHFFNKVKLIVASIREFYADAIFRISVGTAEDAEVPPMIPGVEWYYLDRKEFLQWQGTSYPYLATVLDKYKPPFQGDHILMLDADILCMRRFDELFKERGICGMMTHVPPWQSRDWVALFHQFNAPYVPFKEHSAWGLMVFDEKMRYGPNGYFNSGMLFGPKWAWERFSEHCLDTIDYLKRMLRDNYWFDQAMLPLAMAKAQVPAIALSQRWNFPNQGDFDRRFPVELDDVRFLHYLRTDTIDRDKDLVSLEAAQKLIERTDLKGSNELLRKRLDELLPCLM